MTRRGAALLSIVLLLVCFVALNVAAGALLRTAKIDLTAGKLYTLSAGTKRILRTLEEPITVRVYFSERLSSDYQQINSYGQRVRDLLQQFGAYAQGKLVLDFVDPEPFGQDEEMAEAYGLTGATTDAGEKVFLGLVGTNLVDGKEVVPFLSPDREVYLEYDLVSLIQRLATPEKKKLGIITSLPMEVGPGGYLAALQGRQSAPYVVYEQLSQSFEIEMLDKDADVIPDDIQTLMIAHPPVLSPRALYAIDQFALRGGRLLVFVDPFSESTASAGMGGQPPGSGQQSDLGPLLAAWGVIFDPQKVVLDKGRAIQVQYGADGAVVPYLAWLRLEEADLNRKDLITANINTLQLASAGSLSPEPKAKTEFTPLVTTGAQTQMIPSMILQLGGEPQMLLRDFKPDEKNLIVAARVTGPVETAFPDGPPPKPPKTETAGDDTPEAEEEEPLPAHVAASEAPLNLIVVADADFLEDRFWVNVQSFLGQRIAQPTAGNGFFVVNAVDQLMGSDDLISLRSRSRADRPFTVVQAIERRAQDRYRAEEEALQAKVDETEARLKQLQGGSRQAGSLVEQPVAGPVLTAQQEREVRKFEAELIKTRRALREVQRELRADVIRLGDVVKFLNTALVPIIVAASAVVLAVLRRRRRIAARLAAAKSGG